MRPDQMANRPPTVDMRLGAHKSTARSTGPAKNGSLRMMDNVVVAKPGATAKNGTLHSSQRSSIG